MHDATKIPPLLFAPGQAVAGKSPHLLRQVHQQKQLRMTLYKKTNTMREAVQHQHRGTVSTARERLHSKDNHIADRPHACSLPTLGGPFQTNTMNYHINTVISRAVPWHQFTTIYWPMLYTRHILDIGKIRPIPILWGVI